MTKEICDNKECREDLSRLNPLIRLSKLTGLGYQDKIFCSVKCFLKYVLKNYRRKIAKIIK